MNVLYKLHLIRNKYTNTYFSEDHLKQVNLDKKDLIFFPCSCTSKDATLEGHKLVK